MYVSNFYTVNNTRSISTIQFKILNIIVITYRMIDIKKKSDQELYLQLSAVGKLFAVIIASVEK